MSKYLIPTALSSEIDDKGKEHIHAAFGVSTSRLLLPLSISGHLQNNYIGAVGEYQYTSRGGKSPINFSITSGNLPVGATLSSNGIVSYNYSTTGLYSWIVTAVDSLGSIYNLPDNNLIHVELPPAIAHWPMDDTNSTARDISPNGFNLTYQGSVTKQYAELPFGTKGARFTGGVAADTTPPSSLYLAGSNSSTSNFAVAAWIITEAQTIAHHPIIAALINGASAVSTNWRMDMPESQSIVRGQSGRFNTGNQISSASIIAKGQPTLVVFTVTNGFAELYVNTTRSGSTRQFDNNFPPITSGGHMLIGGDTAFPTSYRFTGTIGNVILFDAPLTGPMVANLHAYGPSILTYKTL